MHRTYIFFLQRDGQIRPIPSAAYVCLVRGETAMREYAGKRLRVADLYVALKNNAPAEIENETYNFLDIDENGRANPHAGSGSLEQNRAFYRAALGSQYANIDCDPKVREVREQIGDQFSWLPTDEERGKMRVMIFESDSTPDRE